MSAPYRFRDWPAPDQELTDWLRRRLAPPGPNERAVDDGTADKYRNDKAERYRTRTRRNQREA